MATTSRVLALLLGPVLLGGCTGEPPPQAAPEPPPAATPLAPTPLAQVRSLAGEWRVAGIDGREFNEPYGLALSADERAIWWEPRCAGMVRGYRIEGGRITFGPDPGLPPRRPGDPTAPVCAIAPPPRLADVVRALAAATTIGRTPQNAVLIAGGDHSLLLFSQ